jgi:hypothetical protein
MHQRGLNIVPCSGTSGGSHAVNLSFDPMNNEKL